MPEIGEMIDGWEITNRRNDYNFVYKFFFVFHVLFANALQPLPDPPDIIYTLVNRKKSASRKITLSGVHKPEELEAAVARLR